MKPILILSILFIATISGQAQTGEKIFKAKCASCHLKESPKALEHKGTPEYKAAMSKLLAPPMSKISMKLKGTLPNIEDFVNFIAEYIDVPDAKKSLCNPHMIKKFGLMPAMPNILSESERTILLEWIYESLGKESCSCNSCKSDLSKKNTPKAKMKCAPGKCGGAGKIPKAPKAKMKCAAGKCGK